MNGRHRGRELSRVVGRPGLGRGGLGVAGREDLLEQLAARRRRVAVSEDPNDGSVLREGGCSSAADTPIGDDIAYLVTVRQEAMDFLATIDQDSRLADVDAAWASCMADAGFADRSPRAAQERFLQEQLAAFVDGVGPEPSVVTGWRRRGTPRRRRGPPLSRGDGLDGPPPSRRAGGPAGVRGCPPCRPRGPGRRDGAAHRLTVTRSRPGTPFTLARRALRSHVAKDILRSSESVGGER